MSEADFDRPYASKTFAEVVDDYVLVRGDLSEPYARAQLVREHELRLSDLRIAVELLTQAMWDARCWMGFDPDGDDRFHSTDWAEIADHHVREAREIRSDLEAAMDEAERAEGAVAALRSALGRTESNFIAAVNGRPVRDMSETLAENRAALGLGEVVGSAQTGSQAVRSAHRGSDGPSGVSGSGANRGDGA